MRDRENAGLRGPVKNCVEEIVHPTGTIFLAYEYAADGRLLALRQTNPDGSVSVTSHDYDADGRLTKIVSGNVSEPGTVWLYTYNENGKVTEPTDVEGKVIRTNYHRDLQGRKIAVKSFSSKVLEQYRGGVGTDSFWHAAESGIGVPDEGSVVTVYDDRDLPIEMRILDKKGRSLTRFIRTYDANGRMLEERQILENPALGMVERLSAEQGSEFDETRLEAMNKAMSLMMAGKNGTGKWHRYDAQGRLVEVRDRNFAVETVTTTSYNEHGNISEVRTTRTDNLAFAAGVQYSIDENGVLAPTGPVPDQPTLPKVVFETDITEYRYEYDEYDNWTRETTVRRFGANEHSAVRRHVLTYY